MGEQAEEYFEDLRADKEARRAALEPQRREYAMRKLTEAGCVLGPGPDENSLRVTKGGRSWNFWPYTGWWAGPNGNRRGIASLLQEVNR